jgi:XRE family transcriptional regulator, regulator of sulfur utilization
MRRRVIQSVSCAAVLLLTSPARPAGPRVLGAAALSWEEIQAKVPEGKRAAQLFRDPTATLDELEVHVTFLPAGQSSHAPHTHPNEEIIIIKEGTLEAFLGGQTHRLGPGGLIFAASNVPHAVTNVGTATAVYHVINWHSPGAKKDAAKD